jgi:putative ABC transport system permease protein
MLANYLKIAFAVFKRRPFFTFVNLFGITFTLAILLIGTAMLDHVFAGRPPEVHQQRTLSVLRVAMTSDEEPDLFATALPSYDLLDRNIRGLPGAEKVSISSIFWKAVSFVDGQRIDSWLKYTDAEFFEILRFEFLEGRPFTRDEVASGSHVAVINRATRERHFGGAGATGRKIEVDGKSFRVVGVVENVPILRFIPFADIWVPQTIATNYRGTTVLGTYQGLILAESRERFPHIQAEFQSRMATVDLSNEGSYNRLIAVPETFFEGFARLVFSQGRNARQETARLLRWLLALAVLFMVLPAINLVNLNVSRIMERASEIGVRRAFGAPTATLIGQFVVENVVLTLVGGVLAVFVAFFVLDLVSRTGWIPYADFHLNPRILLYALAASLFFGLFSGVYPAWRMSRMHPVEALTGGRS